MRRRLLGSVASTALGIGLLAVPTPATPAELSGVHNKPTFSQDVTALPAQTKLKEYPENPQDAAIKLGLMPYHGIAPELNRLQSLSDRVSVEVIGESSQGRELYFVTVTQPESHKQVREQEGYREQIEADPQKASQNKKLVDDYKVPLFVNNNIHGNEWEGTDAALQVIEELATSTDTETVDLLSNARLYFNITANPDGRVNNHRATAQGFDPNRDFVTASQPEVRALRDQIIEVQPAAFIDLHGYVNGTLIEPTTPPHGQNYEFDIFIQNTYANGLNLEAAINGLGYTPEKDGVQPAQIPFRDSPDGWDGWPPIFTPQYAAFQGAVMSQTIEIPLRVNNADYANLPAAELQRRSVINKDVAATAIRATASYVLDNADDLVADQIEVFRRGEAGEAQHPAPEGLVPGLGPEDIYTTEFPRAYVVPAGDDQRSATAAARLVDFLIANDIEVSRASKAFELDGVNYAAGSYVVDMHQAKRGLANVMLELGGDITDAVGEMYDISGWSHSALWGATVTPVINDSLKRVKLRPVAVAEPTGRVADGNALSLSLRDGKDVAALNELLSAGVEVVFTGDGAVVIPGSARDVALDLADKYGVVFTAAAGSDGAKLSQLTVAAAGSADDIYTLRELGFDVRPVSTATLNTGFDWSGIDVLYVSSGLRYSQLNANAKRGVDAFLASGGGVVATDATGATFNAEAGLLTATTVAGRSDANGVVNVTSTDDVLAANATPYSFVYSPRWFTDLGSEVTVVQRFGDDPLASGHWRADANGNGGQDQAAGQAAVVRGTDERGSDVVLFGTEPMFRNHPKGLFAQVGLALLWAAGQR